MKGILIYLFFWFKAKPFCLFSAVQSLPSSAGLAGLADGVGKKGGRARTKRGQAHPRALRDGFHILLRFAREQMRSNEGDEKSDLLQSSRSCWGALGYKKLRS